MNPKTPTDQYDDDETERRATQALRRALTTPYKPQKEMVGKTAQPSPKKQGPAKKTPKST
jgi:hypothetical protein